MLDYMGKTKKNQKEPCENDEFLLKEAQNRTNKIRKTQNGKFTVQ